MNPGDISEVAPFWAGIADDELRITRCLECQHWQWPPRSYCLRCSAARMSWAPVTGTGTVFSWIGVHHPATPGTKQEVPFTLALVELTDAPVRVLGPVRGVDETRAGMRCAVSFEPFGELSKAPVWRPA